MAIGYYHCEERQNRSARQYEYNTRTGEFTGKGKEDLVCSGNSNMPDWAKDNPALFWQANDKYEKGTKGKSIIIALPNEMDSDELKHLMEKTVDKLYPNHAVSWSIHDSIGPSGIRNKHAHVQVCERLIDPDRPVPPPEQYFKKTRTRKDGTVSGGYKKDPRMNGAKRQKWLESSKKMWVEICNEEIRQMRDTFFRPRPNEIVMNKSKEKKSVHFPRRTWMAAMRNLNRPDNFLVTSLNKELSTIVNKRLKDIGKLKSEYIEENTPTEKLISYIWHPFSKKNREKELWNNRIAKTSHWDKHMYNNEIFDINKNFVVKTTNIIETRSANVAKYAQKFGIKSIPLSINPNYQRTIDNLTTYINQKQKQIDNQAAEEARRTAEEKREKAEREKAEQEKKRKEQQRIEQLHQEQLEARRKWREKRAKNPIQKENKSKGHGRN